MAFKYEECQWCVFHDVEPGICDECEDASEYQPQDDDDAMSAKKGEVIRLKVAA